MNQNNQMKNKLMNNNTQNNDELKRVKEELSNLKDLLNKPHSEIAKYHSGFKLNYDKEQEILAEWMVSQKAFKELAIQYGQQLNKNPTQIKNEGFELEKQVLSSVHDPLHQTNVTNFIKPFVDNLLEKNEHKSINFQKKFATMVKNGQIYQLGETIPSRWTDVFDSWVELVKTGNKEALFNLGHCFHFGDGTDPVLEHAAYFYHEALKLDEPHSAFNLFLLYKTPEFSHFDEAKSEEYLELAIKMNEPRAIKHSQEQAKKTTLEIPELTRPINFDENELFNSLQNIIVGGSKPTETLHKLKQTNFKWAKNVEALHNCIITFSTNNVVNQGTFFKPKKVADVTMNIINNSNQFLQFYIGADVNQLTSGNIEELKPHSSKEIKLAFAVPLNSKLENHFILLHDAPNHLVLNTKEPFVIK